MKRVMISYAAKMKEVIKLQERLEKAEKKLEKVYATAEKYGVRDWTKEDYLAWMETVEVVDFTIVNKEDIKKRTAYNDISWVKHDIDDIKRHLDYESRQLEALKEKHDAFCEELKNTEDAKAKEALWEADFEQEQKEWAKDGITLEERYAGKTPKGQRFYIIRNSGYTDRSFHCFTLTVGTQTVFTSGEFWRAYMEIKRR